MRVLEVKLEPFGFYKYRLVIDGSPGDWFEHGKNRTLCIVEAIMLLGKIDRVREV